MRWIKRLALGLLAAAALPALSTDRKITSGFRFEKGYNEGIPYSVTPQQAIES